MSSAQEVKRTEHQLRSTDGRTRIVRISVTDPDATDSSSDEEEGLTIDHRGKPKRFITEIKINPTTAKQKSDYGNPKEGERRKTTTKRGRGAEKVESSNVKSESKKFRGVHQRLWGRWAAEFRDCKAKTRLWLGTFDTAEEAAIAYDHAAIKLRGHKAVTNLIPPPSVDHANSGSDNPLP